MTPEARERCSISQKNRFSDSDSWNKGKTGLLKHSLETRKQMSDSHKSYFKNGGFNWMKGRVSWKKGKKTPLDVKKKISETLKVFYMNGGNKPFLGKHHSSESKIIMSKKGIGRSVTEETKEKISKSSSGEKSCHWLGGKSFELYSKEFNERLKRSIRKRDGYKCMECKYSQKDLKKTLAVHHIDYNKKNNNPENLISLCNQCHAKTNYRREDWIQYFKNLKS